MDAEKTLKNILCDGSLHMYGWMDEGLTSVL